MKIDEGLKKMKERYQQKVKIRKSKAHDYAKDADCLNNFKVMASIAKVLKNHGMSIPIDRPEGVAFWHLLHKYVRVLNLWTNNELPENESLLDSHIDLQIYDELALECEEDTKDT